jgi:hypothetical protein
MGFIVGSIWLARVDDEMKSDTAELIARHLMNVGWLTTGGSVYVSAFDVKGKQHAVHATGGNPAENLQEAVERVAAKIEAANRGKK